MIEDTSRRDPLVHLMGSMSDGLDRYVTDMEAAGQRQIVASELLPVDMTPADEAPWTALGFEFGDVKASDPLFREAKLPDGWKRAGGGHPMWSNVLDDRGLTRVSIFYKAAFYDRSAHMALVDVGEQVASDAIYGDGEPTIPWELLTDGEKTQARASIDRYLTRAATHPAIYGERAPRAELLKASAP